MKSRVKEIMEAKGATIRTLMEQTGFANKTILSARRGTGDLKAENGNICKCTLGTLDRIAQALGVSVHDLFDDTPDRPDSSK